MVGMKTHQTWMTQSLISYTWWSAWNPTKPEWRSRWYRTRGGRHETPPNLNDGVVDIVHVMVGMKPHQTWMTESLISYTWWSAWNTTNRPREGEPLEVFCSSTRILNVGPRPRTYLKSGNLDVKSYHYHLNSLIWSSNAYQFEAARKVRFFVNIGQLINAIPTPYT